MTLVARPPLMPGPPDELDAVSPALESVIGRFRTMVRSVAVRHRLPEDALEDVVQEVRIRLWRAFPTGEQIGRLGASYVYRTATSAALDLLRRRRARGGDVTDPADERLAMIPTETPGPHAELESSQTVDEILGTVEALIPPRRAVVRMYLSGYGREEIADVLGWSEARTRNLLYRGLADLRERLRERGIDPERVA